MSKQTKLETAERVLASLEEKRAEHIRVGTDLMDEQASVALAAHTGDSKARKRLDEINVALGQHTAELGSIDAALRVAAGHVQEAKQREAEEEGRANAARVRKLWGAFVECGKDLDACLHDLAELGKLHGDLLSQLHNAGCAFPTHQQLDTLGAQAVATALMRTPWHHRYEHLAPSQRRTFRSLMEAWSQTIDSSVAQRLGKKERADAERKPAQQQGAAA